jgi:hypothetical protein
MALWFSRLRYSLTRQPFLCDTWGGAIPPRSFLEGKLALWQAADLYDFVAAIPGQGSMVIISMLPDDLPHGE